MNQSSQQAADFCLRALEFKYCYMGRFSLQNMALDSKLQVKIRLRFPLIVRLEANKGYQSNKITV